MDEQLNKAKCFNNETFFTWIDDDCFRNETALRVIASTELRGGMSVVMLSNILGISRKKIYEIECGTSKDFNSINNYINFFNKNFVF